MKRTTNFYRFLSFARFFVGFALKLCGTSIEFPSSKQTRPRQHLLPPGPWRPPPGGLRRRGLHEVRLQALLQLLQGHGGEEIFK